MMGQHDGQPELFSYQVNLDKRVRPDHPLRAVARQIDFTFVRAEVAQFYGKKGNVSVDPVVILKMMFLLFFDNVPSERELMAILPERLDYLWFLGYGLNDQVPNHTVLSKARSRWGAEVFEQLFLRTIAACVNAGLVDGTKVHLDGSLIRANASTDSIRQGPPELVAALRKTYQEQAAKLSEEPEEQPGSEAPQSIELEVAETEQGSPPSALKRAGANQTHVSTTDPDAQLMRKRRGPSLPSYKEHRLIDDAYGVITAHVVTKGSVQEDTQLFHLIAEHEKNTSVVVQTAVADSQYGTVENILRCGERGIQPHMANLKEAQDQAGLRQKFFTEEKFTYDGATDTYQCPAGQVMKRWQKRAEKKAYQYMAAKGTCDACQLRSQCTEAQGGRRIQRFDQQQQIEQGRAVSRSQAARKDRRRRKHLMEGSFADAANQHGFKRARWRRLWRQSIQSHLIAACQNIRILMRNLSKKPSAGQKQRISVHWVLNCRNYLLRLLTYLGADVTWKLNC